MIKKWYKNCDKAEKDALKFNGEIVTVSNGWTDIYYVIPLSAKRGEVAKVTTLRDADGGGYRCIYKDETGNLLVIEGVSKYRLNHYLGVPIDKRADYLNGYYTRREETSKKIQIFKEAARRSHAICDLPGEYGHKIRQELRYKIRQELSTTI